MGIEDRIEEVLERHESFNGPCFTWSCACGTDFHDDKPTSTGGSHFAHVAAAVVAELQLTDETQFIHPFGYGEAVERRWVTQWEKEA